MIEIDPKLKQKVKNEGKALFGYIRRYYSLHTVWANTHGEAPKIIRNTLKK